METTIIQELMKQYQRQYSILSELYRLTVQMGDLLSKNDQGSVQLVLGMRQEEIDKVTQCKTKIAILLDGLESDERQRLSELVKEGGNGSPKTPEEKKLMELSQNARNMLGRTIELDRRINLKVAGKDSFYSK